MLRQVGEQIQWGQSLTIPAPVGGLNARDPLDNMASTDAIRLKNMFPKEGHVELRKGFDPHATGMGSGVVETLAEHSSAAGAVTMIAAANSNLYNASSAAAASSLKSGLTNNRWQTNQFKGVLILVNGDDQPQQWDGSTLSDATYTGIADDSVLIHVTNYRQRLYLIEKNSTSAWYGGVGSITGALTELDIADQLRFGGYLNAVVTWTVESGDSYDERIVFITSEGEGLVFSGSDPGDATWALVARFKLAEPLGRRCFLNYGADVLYLCKDGIYPLSRAVLHGKEGNIFERLTDKIQRLFNDAAGLYGAYFGWQMAHYPKEKMLIVNVPTVEGQSAIQYVMNTQTGAWCQFSAINAQSWAVYNEEPHFGGTDGISYEFNVGNDDNGSEIEIDLKQAFNYVGDRATCKHFNMLKPILRATTDIELQSDVDVDLADSVTNNTVSVAGSGGTEWGSEWGSSWSPSSTLKQPVYSLTGIGRCAAIKYQGAFSGLELSLYSSHLYYISGGTL